jgi:alanyl-tRNA synthetase
MANNIHPAYLSSNEIRRLFLDYFYERQHTLVPSSSLVPANDPTLLFTNAGMVQFKEVFLGHDIRSYQRAASSQRCVRAGGKHNDLERVGYTARHHTFFEMLGNFSFGDYFKREAIQFAWEFLVKKCGLSPEKLWVTVFKEDQEAEDIWLNEIKIDPSRFSRCGEDDNFWAMGPTGPCGPCTEIFYDHGDHIPGGPPGSAEADGDRYIEIWNLVFMQYNRSADGALTPLPKPSVDTGMGLERVSAVLQGVNNNYDTDLFQPLIKAAAKLAGLENLQDFSLRVIADHIRSCSFLITDGVLPSNEGRGYVLRRIIRRAIRHGHQLGLTQTFFYKLVQPLVNLMGEAYPELTKAQSHIEKVLSQEEEQFSITLNQGIKHFTQAISELKTNVIPGDIVFKLYDTYGFPADLTADMAREQGLSVDIEGFESAMTKQRERSREASQFTVDYHTSSTPATPTEFVGYKNLVNTETDTGTVLALYKEGQFTNELHAGEKGAIVLNRTPFYAESGGQVGDQGQLFLENQCYFQVLDTIKQGHMHLHLGKLNKGVIKIGDTVKTIVDAKRRAAIILNHTATHLLHLVLKQVLGEHAIQKGSLVEAERLRFDFSHPAPLTKTELKKIEYLVNEAVRANHQGKVHESTPEEAFAQGAIGLFGEKYGNTVRVVHFGPSVELCGGTHAEHTGDIGLFKITTETGIAAGIRRIEAVTGESALNYLEKCELDYQQKLTQADDRIYQLEKNIQQLKDNMAEIISKDLIHQAKEVNNIKVLAKKVENLDGKALRPLIDQLKKQWISAIIVLATVKDQKISIVGGVTEDLFSAFSAKDIVNQVASQVGGKGGGRLDLAEAGGNNPLALEKALASVYTLVEQRK